MQYTVLMGNSWINDVRHTRIAKRAAWVAPSLALAVLGGVVLGFMLGWLLYWAFNVIGVWTYCDSRGSDSSRTQRWFKALSMVLVPTGVIALLAGGGGMSGIDAAHANSNGDEMLKALTASGPGSPGASGGSV